MFSGIVDSVGEVCQAEPAPDGARLVVGAADYFTSVRPGASIAVDGVCLTVTSCQGGRAAFDVVAETLRRTTLGALRANDRVNLQKSLTAGSPIDGHFVQGHVDAVGEVVRVDQSERESMWWFTAEADALRRIIPKGSVAIDGISLTVARVDDELFSAAIIPTTLQRTTLGGKRAGAKVNIETDILVRAVLQHLESIEGLRPRR